MGASPLLVTYGTLMQAAGGFERLGVADQVSVVGACRFEGRLHDFGRFPGAVPGAGTVYGELVRLSDAQAWTGLDRYEGYDPDNEAASLFVRRRVSLTAPADQTAWVYWYNDDPGDAPRVPSGDWHASIRGGGPS